VVIEMGIIGYPNCRCGYDQITATASGCTPLVSFFSHIRVCTPFACKRPILLCIYD